MLDFQKYLWSLINVEAILKFYFNKKSAEKFYQFQRILKKLTNQKLKVFHIVIVSISVPEIL